MRSKSIIIAAFLVSAAILGSHNAQAANPDSTIEHVFVIVLENQDFNSIYGNASAPYLNQLMDQYVLLTKYYAVHHPSLPNYLAMVAGDYFQISDDKPPSQHIAIANNSIITTHMDAKGITWKGYMESMPTACNMSSSGLYAVKHNPFVYFHDVTGNESYCKDHVVDFDQLNSDISANDLPNFGYIVPNLRNDGHNTGISGAELWLSKFLPRLSNSPSFDSSVIFVTFDESDKSSSDNHVATMVIGPPSIIKSSYQSNVHYDHYSLLKTIEWIFELGDIGAHDASAPFISDIFAPGYALISEKDFVPSDQLPPQSNVTVTRFSIKDAEGRVLTNPFPKDRQLLISATITDNRDNTVSGPPQPFVAILEARDRIGNSTGLQFLGGELNPSTSIEIGTSWTPKLGDYSIGITIIRDLGNPEVISASARKSVTVQSSPSITYVGDEEDTAGSSNEQSINAITVSQLANIDQMGKVVDQPMMGSQFIISTDINNKENNSTTQPFVAILEIENRGGVVTDLQFLKGEVGAAQQIKIGFQWSIAEVGNYNAKLLVLSDLNSPEILSPTIEKSVIVGNADSSQDCDRSLWAHVYDPARLHILDPCITVTGHVTGIIKEDDGDYHMNIRVDPQFQELLNGSNEKYFKGTLVVEAVCQLPSSYREVISVCKDYSNEIPQPAIGQHVSVAGSYVLDIGHAGWAEIHPVTSIIILN